jgi:hypothetical protein
MAKSDGILVRVVAPYFVAGLIVDERGTCIHAAPILVRFIGCSATKLRAHFAARGWKATVLP